MRTKQDITRTVARRRVPSGPSCVDLLDRLPVAVLCLTPSGNAVYVNRTWSTLSGLDRESSSGHGWARGLEPAVRDRILQEIRADAGTVDCALDSSRGRRWTRWCWLRATGTASRVVTVVDLSADHRKAAELSRQATHDALTDAANRRAFLVVLADALREDGHRQVGIVYADLDGFKHINDTAGHAQGDKVLRLVAQRFRQHLRDGDLLGRVGGDEFAVLCRGPAPKAMSVVERMAKALRDPFSVDGAILTVSATFGVAVAGADDDPESLLSRADRAMYDAKGTAAAAPPAGCRGDAAGRRLEAARLEIDVCAARADADLAVRLARVAREIEAARQLLGGAERGAPEAPPQAQPA